MTQATLMPELPAARGGTYYMTDGIRIKIGYTDRPPRRRGGELKTEMLLFIPGPPSTEDVEHMRWAELRMGSTEWFNISFGLVRWLTARMDRDDLAAQRALDWLIENHYRRSA